LTMGKREKECTHNHRGEVTSISTFRVGFKVARILNTRCKKKRKKGGQFARGEMEVLESYFLGGEGISALVP